MSKLSRRTVLGAATTGAVIGHATSRGFAAPPRPGWRGPARDGIDEGEVLYSTSFETDEEIWLTDPTTYATDQVRTGDRSLRYLRTDPEQYVLPGISVPVVPGERYEAIAWIRTEGLDGVYNRGAQIGMDAWTADGAWVDGSYAGATRATDHWHKSRALYRAKPTVAEVKVSAYIYTGITGTAWFDDLEIRRLPRILMQTELLHPGYRGLLVPGDHDSAAVRARVLVDDPTGHSVEFHVLDADGGVLSTETAAAAAVVEREIAFDDRDPGRYGVAVELVDPAGTVIASEQWGLERTASAPANWVDRHGRLVRDGELWFPLGFYNRIEEPAVNDLAGTPFSTILSYHPHTRDALDLAHAHGLSVIYALNSFFYDTAQGAKPDEIIHEEDEIPTLVARVEELRDHPALLAWYMADEPYEYEYDRLITHYDALVDTDPDHPAYIVVNQAPEPAGVFMRSTDVIGGDSYPVHGVEGEPIDQVTERADAVAAQMPNRGLWHVPQAFGWSAYNPSKPEERFPTLQEIRNMTWQFLCQGAQGLIYYSLKDLRVNVDSDPTLTFAEAFGRVETVGAEVLDLVPVLQSVEATPAMTVPDQAWVNTLVKAHDGMVHLFVVNHTKSAQTGDFVAPTAISVSVVGEDRTVPLGVNGEFSDDFASLDVRHYLIEQVGFSSLAEETRQALGPDRGRVRAGTSLLERAQAASDRDDQQAAETLLESYRGFISRQAGHALSEEEATRLMRLSELLV